MIISLTGFMGSGKSSVGRKLSELLCCPFVDLDAEIEARAGRSIADIFASDGEAEFRRIEKETLSEVLRGWGEGMPGQSLPSQATGPSLCGQRGSTVPSSPLPSHSTSAHSLIVALGGGAVMTPECEEMVHRDTVCIYLRASVDTLIEHLEGETAGRPLLANTSVREAERRDNPLLERITKLMALRSSTYERTAHIILDTDGKGIDQIAEEIVTLLP